VLGFSITSAMIHRGDREKCPFRPQVGPLPSASWSIGFALWSLNVTNNAKFAAPAPNLKSERFIFLLFSVLRDANDFV